MDKIYLFCLKESGALIELSLGSMNKFGPWFYQCACINANFYFNILIMGIICPI